MKEVFAIFTALLKNWLRSGTGVFFSFLFPMMLLLIFGAVFGGTGNAKYLLYIQNLDLKPDGTPTELSSTLVQVLNTTETFVIRNLEASINVSSYVKEKPTFTTYRVLIIPEGFHQKAINKSIAVRTGIIMDTLIQIEEIYAPYMNETERQSIIEGRETLSRWRNTTVTGENAELLILTDQGDSAAPIVKGILYSVVNTFNNRLIGAEPVVDLTSQSLVTRRLKAADYYVPGYIAAFIMTNGIVGVTSTISEYRRNGVIKRLAATPMSKSAWVISNVLQQTFLALVLTAVMILLGWVVFEVRAIPDAYALALIFLGSVTFCSIGMTLGGVIKDVEAASAAGNAIAFPMMFLSGAFWPIENMPSYLQGIAKILPLYYFHDGLRWIMINQNPAQSVLAFLIMGVLAAIFMATAIKITKWKDL